MAFTFDASGSQINGARDYQEDAFLITQIGTETDNPDAGCALVIVADGMGGHAAGNVASNMAVQTFNRYMTANYPSELLDVIMKEGVMAANDAIEHIVKETPALKGMGCTFVGAVLQKKELFWVSVGDSNLYLIRDNLVHKKNADHSYGGFLDRMAEMGKPMAPEPGFSRNMLMSALTGEDIADIDCPAVGFDLQAGDRIILASDGMDTIPDKTVLDCSVASKTARDCAKALLDAVTAAKMPRQDNTTVVVVDVQAKAAPAAKPAPSNVATFGSDRKQPAPGSDITQFALPGSDAPKPKPAPAPATPVPVVKKPYAPPKKSALPLVAGILLLLLAAGGGFYYYQNFMQPKPAPASGSAEGTTAAPTAVEGAAPDVSAAPAGTAPADPAADATTPTAETVAAPAEEKSVDMEAGLKVEAFWNSLSGGGQSPAMVWIPAGNYTMGNDHTAEPDEKPAHSVSIKKFAMSRYEVTRLEYAKFARATGRAAAKGEGDDTPAVGITWEDANAYAEWLTEQTGFTYRLPSESEWEYTANAGGNNFYWWWGRDEDGEHAHCFNCNSVHAKSAPAKAGSFLPNPFGLYDTAGNAAEWLQDCYVNNYKAAPNDGSARISGECKERAVRGGSFESPLKSLRTAKRDKFYGNKALGNIGFRVARDE